MYGAVFEVHIIRNIGETGTMLVQIAPYGRGNFAGDFVNAGAAGDFYLRARCTVWKICAFEINLEVSGDCAPPPRCCDTDGNTESPLTPAAPVAPGPGGSSPVQLATGHEQSEFPADLTVYNPLGPDVEWRRQWREASALSGNGAPGFSAGWTHSYHQTLTARSGANLQLNFSNGAAQDLTAQPDANGVLQLNAPANATYFVRGAAATTASNPDDTTFFWQWVEAVWEDGTVWRFTPADRYVYRLTKITSATGQSLTLDYDSPGSDSALDVYWQNLKTTNYASWLQLAQNSYGTNVTRQWRLKTIKNSAGTALLTLDYRTPDGLLASATDAYNHRIYYSWTQPSGLPAASLTGVSQVFQVGVDTGTLGFDQYGYQAFGARPLLKSVTRIHPNGTGAGGATTATSTNTYDAQGRVASTRDGNNNLRTYTYGTNQVGIAVSNAAGTLVQQWTRFTDAQKRGVGWADASGHRWETFYDDPNNPRLPTRERDPEGRETVTTYDSYGHVTSVSTPRGVKLTYTWSYAAWRLGRLSSVRKTVGALTMPSTIFTYFEPSGLPQSVTAPHPNGSGTVTTQYSYDSYGNVTGISEPGDASTPTRTTQLFYTQDGTFTQPMAVGKPVAVRDPAGNVTHLRYTSNYNLYSATDALGNATVNIYDYNDNPIRTILPATAQTGTGSGEIRYAYAYRGGPLVQTQIYDEAGGVARTFHTEYGAEGEVLSQHGNQLPQSTQYDALYRPVIFEDGNGQQTRYVYNADGRLSATYYPQANTTSGWDSVRTTSFSASGQPLQTVNGRGIVSNYVYNDPDGQLTAIEYPASTWENQSFTYDVLGRLASQSNYSGSESYLYTAAETPLSRTTTYKKTDYSDMAPFTVSYAYNASGSLNQLTTPAGALSYAYDTAGRLASLAEPGGRTTQWNYLSNDWLQSQTLPVNNGGGARSTYAYNALGRVLALSNTRLTTGGGTGATLSQWGSATDATTRLLYNASGQMTRNTAASTTSYPWSGQTTYGYDAFGQVSAENSTRSGSYAYAFGYDGAGNPTSWGGAARSFDADNQETTGNTTTSTNFGYNGDGTPWLYSNRNRLSATGTTPRSQILSYSSDGQLMQINANAGGGAAGAAVAGYGYRSDGLRAWKQDAAGNRTFFYYEGGQLLAVQNQADASTRATVMLWGADGLIGYRWTDASGVNRSRYHLYDVQGNLAQALDEAGNVVETAGVTAHGMPLVNGSAFGVGSAFAYGAKFGYYRDGESGFYLCGFRYYDPSGGRWITRDPIGFAGGSNLYGYVGNNPINAVDPSGLYELWLYTTQVVGGFNHAFLVLHDVNSSGKPVAYYFEGNPQFNSAVDFMLNDFGSVTCDTGDFTDPNSKKRKERADRASKSRLINAPGQSGRNVRDRFFQVMRRIEASQTPYHATAGPNSNSVVRAILEQGLGMNLGNANTVASQLGIWSLPGWDMTFPTGTF